MAPALVRSIVPLPSYYPQRVSVAVEAMSILHPSTWAGLGIPSSKDGKKHFSRIPWYSIIVCGSTLTK